jgi:hypothetical protein
VLDLVVKLLLATMMAVGWFASLNKHALQEYFENVDTDNTKKSTVKAMKVFLEYLIAKNLSADFKNSSAAELDEKLSTFHYEMKNKWGKMYRNSTLILYRHDRQRQPEKIGKDLDIIKGAYFE